MLVMISVIGYPFNWIALHRTPSLKPLHNILVVEVTLDRFLGFTLPDRKQASSDSTHLDVEHTKVCHAIFP